MEKPYQQSPRPVVLLFDADGNPLIVKGLPVKKQPIGFKPFTEVEKHTTETDIINDN